MFSTTEIETHSAQQFLERSRGDATSGAQQRNTKLRELMLFLFFFVQIFRSCMSMFSAGSNTMNSSIFWFAYGATEFEKKNVFWYSLVIGIYPSSI